MQPAEKPTNVPESVLAAMRRTNELFDKEVIVNGDLDALDRVYTANARVLPPGAPVIEGRERIKGFWSNAITAMGVMSVSLTTVEAQEAGDGVIEIGRAELTVESGQIITVKYVVHWKKEDGEWKWNVDIWNQNQ
jgi:ketosteroid isomerase-like protein